MDVAEFDFDLPDDRIALRPVSPRDAARLLEIGGESLIDHTFSALPDLLAPGDALVFNDTRVIAARLLGRRLRGEASAAVEATLLERLSPSRWTALMRPGKRLRFGDRIIFGQADDRACGLARLDATVMEKDEAGAVTLAFDLAGPDLDRAIDAVGQMPLPPYIAVRRPEDARDRIDYQTVYARHDGSVAAPTAGLHFTAALMARLAARGVTAHYVTLHVGAGTFLPVRAERLEDHQMHAEYGEVSEAVVGALNATRAAGGRVVCVGTTALRVLESAAAGGTLAPFAGETAIFITPGYRFAVADGLITNFHLPRSTLLMLVAAFAGLDRVRRAYAYAISTGYRFYSYGDASLMWRA